MRPLKMSSVEICERLLDDVGVALVRSSAFGEQGEGFTRFMRASDEDGSGFRKIIEWAEERWWIGNW